jgi:hypothetical protein
MLAAGEKLAGPYRWDRYDILIMPRSFPYGGMENPRLSFISPSVLAGDRSLVATVVHELAHSWSGNLVTMSSWNDFWLNEGFTSYLERRLSEEIYGKRFADMEDVISRGELVQAIEDLKAAGHEKDSDLKLDLAGRDPDEGSSDVAYEKGRWFLGFLEGRYGRPAFDAFLRGWFDAHAFQSVDTETFRAWLLKDLARPGAPKISSDEIDAWIYGPGLPATTPVLPTDVFSALDRAAKDWREGRIATASLPTKDWVPMEWVRFLDEQPADLPDAKLAELRSAYNLGAAGNAEIALAWLQLAIRTSYEPAYPDLERYLTQTGRWRLVSTLFTDLARTPEGPGARPRDLCEGEAGLSPEHPGRGGARPEAEGADRIRSVVRLVTHELQDHGEPEQHPKAAASRRLASREGQRRPSHPRRASAIAATNPPVQKTVVAIFRSAIQGSSAGREREEDCPRAARRAPTRQRVTRGRRQLQCASSDKAMPAGPHSPARGGNDVAPGP